MNNNYSSFLFASPSFWEGFARPLDLGGTLTEYNSSPSPRAADENAIRSDWYAIGSDINQSLAEMKRVEQIAKKA